MPESSSSSSSVLPTDAWYSNVKKTLESLTTLSRGSASKSDGKSTESSVAESKDMCANAESEAEYLSWVASARERLEELSQKVQIMDWGSFSANDGRNKQKKSGISVLDEASVDSGAETAVIEAESGNTIKKQLLQQISAVQTQLGQRVDQTRLALEDAVHGMLPEQLQKPWVTACAQSCLDQEIHPDLLQSAAVRIGSDMCEKEAAFRTKRTELIRKDFAKFIGVPEASVDHRDIPIIGVAGSGGGFRAMVSTIGSYRAMHQAGLAQCIMYDAAVSGSSWAIAALHTYGQGDPHKVLENVRNVMQHSMFSTSNLMSFVKANDGIAKRVFTDMAARYLLAAAKVEDSAKEQNDKDICSEDANLNEEQDDTVGGLLARVADSIVPEQLQHLYRKEPAVPSPITIEELVQVAKRTVKTVSVPPMSIVELYGALLFKQLIVQHDFNTSEEKSECTLDPRWMKLSSQSSEVEQGVLPMPIYTAVRHFLGTDDNNPDNAEDHRYQWFEFNPYEVGSIDHGMWIPSWAFGRPMVNGKEQFRIGETHFGSIMGMVASAFCASVKAMVMEFYMAVPGAVRSAMDPLLDRFERETETSHIIPPYTLYNPFFKTTEQPSQENSDGKQAELEGTPFLSLMDAGLENNLPFAPLLRPERGVDVLICLDSSANIDIMPWFARAEAWASEHGVERWPWGARPWTADPLRPSKAEIEMSRGTLKSTKKVVEKVEDRVKHKNMRCVIFDHPLAPMPDKFSKERKLDPTISVLYLPLLPNPKFRDSDFDPAAADFCATFNDKWTAEQVDMLADLTSLNFSQEIERIRAAVKKAYERKRAFRMYREAE
ncbi:hypothetical protein H4R99_007510 [Coemansia sp. RSA 1722]|nr:hypothetical protein H4R99_007510 [Coemansia sp. RSA 1722]